MSRFDLDRRSFLRGAGGAALALPALEIMGGRRANAGGGSPPKRFVMMYCGASIAADENQSLLVPDDVGAGYDLKRALLPLGGDPLPNPGIGANGLDVQDHVSVVSGLLIPWDTGGGVPPGGRSAPFHYNTMGPQVSGFRGGEGRGERPRGPSADQIVADAIAGDTLFHSLPYRVQAASYVGNNNAGGAATQLSFRDDGMGGMMPLDPVFSPQLAYSVLFGNFTPPDGELAEAAARRLARHQSIVDLVHTRAAAVSARLGHQDQIRMEQHLDQLRGLEQRLAAVPPTGGDCRQPHDPGEDPPIENSAIEYNGNGGDGLGYSNEDLRGEVLCDMINMAFACDLSRVASMRISYSQSHMQMGPVVGIDRDLHQFTHSSNQQVGHADAIAWHVKFFARLVAQLRDTRDFDGSSLLDHTAVVLLFEGGFGLGSEGGAPLVSHSTQNMVALVGGHAGGLNSGGGKHIIKQDWHPAQAVLSAMYGVGVGQEDETLGEVSGRIPELF